MRLKRRRKKKSSRLLSSLLVAGLLAVGCGWLINTLFIQGYLWSPTVATKAPVVQEPTTPTKNPVTEQEAPATTESQVKLQSFQYYLVQVGALGSEASAEKLVKQLETQGYAGSYAKEGDFFKVYAGIFAQKEAAQATGAILKQLKQVALVKEVVLPGESFPVTGTLAGYFATANEKLAVIDSSFSQLLSASSIDQAKAEELRLKVETAHQALVSLTPPAELQTFHAAVLDASAWLLTSTKQLKEYLESNNELSLQSADSSLMEFARVYQTVHLIIRNILT